jgi:flagellar motor switch protein FliM
MRGMMNLCIPFNSIERIGGKLSANTWTTYGKNASTPETIRLMSDNVRGSVVEVVAQLAETKITTGELIGLRVGDIITTQQDVRAPLVVNVEGLEKFRARAGSYKGRSAIRIEEPVANKPASRGTAASA